MKQLLFLDVGELLCNSDRYGIYGSDLDEEVLTWLEENLPDRYIENTSGVLLHDRFEKVTGCSRTIFGAPNRYNDCIFFKDLEAMMLFKLRWL